MYSIFIHIKIRMLCYYRISIHNVYAATCIMILLINRRMFRRILLSRRSRYGYTSWVHMSSRSLLSTSSSIVSTCNNIQSMNLLISLISHNDNVELSAHVMRADNFLSSCEWNVLQKVAMLWMANDDWHFCQLFLWHTAIYNVKKCCKLYDVFWHLFRSIQMLDLFCMYVLYYSHVFYDAMISLLYILIQIFAMLERKLSGWTRTELL